MKKTLIICAVIFVLGFSFYSMYFKIFCSKYETVVIDDSIEILVNKMGMPKKIVTNFHNQKAQDWAYYVWPIPNVCTFVILDNKVTDKYNSISP